MTHAEFAQIYHRLIEHFGMPFGQDYGKPDEVQEANRRRAQEWYELNRERPFAKLNQAATNLINTRQYKSFPLPGDLTHQYNMIAGTVNDYQDDPDCGLAPALVHQLRQIDDLIWRLPKAEKTRLRDQALDLVIDNHNEQLEGIRSKGNPAEPVGAVLLHAQMFVWAKTKQLMRVIFCREQDIPLPNPSPFDHLAESAPQINSGRVSAFPAPTPLPDRDLA